MKLYYPTSSLNFNDIFATESISPKLFYSRRNFGTKRHFKTELSFNDNFLTLFSKMPFFQLAQSSTSDYDEYPIIIEITHDDSYFHLIKISDDTYATQETIYFSPDKIKLYFLSEAHVKAVLAKSRLVEETKMVFKYRDNFRLIDEDSLIEIPLSDFQYPENNEQFIVKQLLNDSIYNKIKGLIFSYLTKLYDFQFPQFPTSIRNDIEKILEEFDFRLNPYFDIARDQLISASRMYEKGVTLQNKQIQNISFPILVDHYSDGILHFNNKILQDKQEIIFLNEVVNYLIQNHESDQLLSKSEIVIFLDHLNTFMSSSKKFDNEFIKDVKILSDRIVNRNYNSNVKEIGSLVVQNLFAFLLKQDKLDELEIVLKDNDIKCAYLAYCFLGITTGFSSMSRIITNSSANNLSLIDEIDKQLQRIKNQIWKKNYYKNRIINKNSDDNLYGVELIPDDQFIDTEKEVELMLVDRIQRIRESKILKRLKSKKKITLINDILVLFEEIEGDMFIHFNKGKDNYLYILLRSKNNSTILEEQNNFKENLRRLGIEKSNISRIAQGNFPIFFYFKVNGNYDEPLSIDDKKTLLDFLDFLIAK